MTILPVAYLGSAEYFARILAGGCTIDLGEHYVKRSQRNRACILSANGPLALSVQLRRANHPCTPVRDVRIDYSKRWQHQHWIALVSAYRASPYFDHYAGVLEPFYRRRFGFLADYDLELTAVLLRLLGDVPMPALSERYVDAGPEDLDLRERSRERGVGALRGGTLPSEGDAGRPGPAGDGPGAAAGRLRDTESTATRSEDGCAGPAAHGLEGFPPAIPAVRAARSDGKGPVFVAEPYFQLFSDRMPFVGNLSVIDLLFEEGPSSGTFLRRCLR